MWIQIETAFDTFVRGLWTFRALFLLPGSSYSLKFLKYLGMEGLNVQDETSNVKEGSKWNSKKLFSLWSENNLCLHVFEKDFTIHFYHFISNTGYFQMSLYIYYSVWYEKFTMMQQYRTIGLN